MSTSTSKSFWISNNNNATSNPNIRNVDLLKISSVNPAPIVSPTQVELPSDLIGCSNLENNIKQDDIKCNGQIISNHYSLLTVSHSPVFAKSQNRVSNFKNQKYPCFRSKQHFRRKISSRSHTWSDAASSISSSSGPIHSHAATDGEKSPVNSHLQSNENITDSISVENIPRLNLKSNYCRLMHMTIDGKTNQDFSQKNDSNRMYVNNKPNQMVTGSLSQEENNLKNVDSKSETKFSTKPEFTTLAPCKGTAILV